MDQPGGVATLEELSARTGIARRIIAHPISLAMIGSVLLIAIASGGSIVLQMLGVNDGGPSELAGAIVLSAAVIGGYKGFKRWIERAPDAEYRLTGAVRELGAGLGIGFVLFTLMALSVMALGGLTISGIRSGLGDFWSWAAIALVSGVFEETLFRGILLRLIEKVTGSWVALGLTAAFFGFAHLMNPNATVIAGVAIMIEAGVLLGAAYFLTRRLWLAIGIHAAWNFTQGWIFSLPVSGSNATVGLLVTSRHGPDWLIGGHFGLEASASAVAVATLAGFAMLALADKRGGLVPPFWVKPKTA